jgi:ATP-binding cassette, subfamily B, bacterial HlyB/CyaB
MHTGLACLEALSGIHHVPMDTRSIIRDFGISEDEVRPEVLMRAAQRQGFRVKRKQNLDFARLEKHYPLPAIAIELNGKYFLALKADKEKGKVLIFDPEEKKTKEVLMTNLPSDWLVLWPKNARMMLAFGFGWFLTEFLVYKRVIVEVILGSAFVQMIAFTTPLLTQVILDKVIVHHSLNTLNVITLAFGVLTLFDALLNMTRHYIFTHTANKLDAKLGAKLFHHLFRLPFVYFESRKVGTIISRLRELETIRDFVINKSVTLLVDLFFSFAFLGIMLVYSWQLTLVVVGFIVAMATLFLVLTPMFRSRLEEKFQMSASSNAYLVEAVTGVQTIKSLAIEGIIQRNWEDKLGAYLHANFSLARISNTANSLISMLQRLMTISILYMGVLLVIDNKLSVGQLIAFQMFANQLTQPVMRLVNSWNEFQQALLAVNRLSDILNHPTEIQSSQAITLPNLRGQIKSDKLTFAYAPSAPKALDNVSFNIPAGACVGFVGRSGSGKSTISKIIQRLYLPHEGALYVDGIDVRQMNPGWLRQNIGVVLQENYLFSGTIRDNIAMPMPDAPMERVIRAAQLAGAHEFITVLPEGYDTEVGERGSTLSGGQKQRIAIARALITNPRIIIFDEATSALDYESERIVNSNLASIRKGRTVIVISHRLSSLLLTDSVIAFERGRVVEVGPIKTLMNKPNGYVAKLFSHAEDEDIAIQDVQLEPQHATSPDHRLPDHGMGDDKGASRDSTGSSEESTVTPPTTAKEPD